MDQQYQRMIETLKHTDNVSGSDIPALLNLAVRTDKPIDGSVLEQILDNATRQDLSDAMDYINGAMTDPGIQRYGISSFQYEVTKSLKKNIYNQIKKEFNGTSPKKYRHVKPVIRTENGLSYTKDVDPTSTAFTWDPKPSKKAKDLEPYGTIATYHSWVYYGFFKPSLAEVLVQIPESDLGKIVAFETDTDVQIIGSLHKTVTTLYKRSG